MNTLLKSTAAFGLVLSFAAFGATDAFAKAHDQGRGDRATPPGENVFEETVEPAQQLGEKRGNSGNTPAADKSKRDAKDGDDDK